MDDSEWHAREALLLEHIRLLEERAARAAALVSKAVAAMTAAKAGMTDDEARSILSDCEAWIDWDDEQHKPVWSETIGLNGYFTADQLRAVLHFAGREEG